MLTRKLTPVLLACVLAITSSTYAQAASELLEKGIFTEETVGDLDKAIDIYKQVVEESEANRKLAAQAQLRLAMCYLKKGQDDEATTAFEKLIENYPDQKELVAEARDHMPGRLVIGPVAWEDGEVMRLGISLPTGMKIGTFIWSVNQAQADAGEDVWRMKTRRYIAINGSQGVSSVDANKEDFRPLTSRFMHTILGETNANYSPKQVEIISIAKGEDTTNAIDLEVPVYDNEQAVYLIRRLPLEVGYKTTLPIMATFGSQRLDIPITVLEKETLTVPAGEFECYKVDLLIKNVMHQTMWFSADEKKVLVKLNAEGIVGELIAVEMQAAGDVVEYTDSKFGFTLSAPTGWSFYQTDQTNPTESGVHLVDPDATAMNLLDVDTLESLELNASQTPREMLESHLKRMAQHRADFKTRDDSWVEHTVGGRPAVSLYADFVDQGKPVVVYITAIAGETTLTKFKTLTTSDKLDKAKSQIDTVIATYKAK